MARLVRIETRKGRRDRVVRGTVPAIDLVLGDGERLLSFDLREQYEWSGDRKTVDWYWTATVECPNDL